MVGTLEKDGETYALVLDERGGVHRVQIGDYMGTNWGQIQDISIARIDLIEIVADGAGGWLRRPRSIELSSQ
jgi:type IV pilus assembly protein PilP